MIYPSPDYLSRDALADALGGEWHLIDHYEVTTRDTPEEVAACIVAACEDYGVSVGKGEELQPFTFSADVRDLANRLLEICPVAKAAPMVPTATRWTPTIGTLQLLAMGGRAA